MGIYGHDPLIRYDKEHSIPDLVVISCTGRALAASAMRANKSVHIIDCFSDADTALYAKSVQQIRCTDFGLDYAVLQQAIRLLLEQRGQLILVPCSGFEYRPGILKVLTSLAPCLGNNSETVYRCKNPDYFFSLLKGLSVPHPETKITSPPRKGQCGWLIKKTGAMGGAHVQYYQPDNHDLSGCYLQRYIPGLSMSAVFITNGKRHHILGLSEHFFRVSDANFTLAGAVTIIDNTIYHSISRYLSRLIPALGLRGLCGIDFIVDDQSNIFILEINPRPPATFELHEEGRSFFDWHLQSCRGVLPAAPLQKRRQQYSGMLNIYTSTRLLISSLFKWPDWCRNRPTAGAVIAQYKPVCTVYATAKNKKKVLYLLNKRQKKIFALLQK